MLSIIISPLLTILFLCLSLSMAQEVPKLTYYPFEEGFSKQIILESVEADELQKTTINHEISFSPNKLATFTLLTSTFDQDPPWSSTVYIEQHNHMWRLQLRNHANITPRLFWINDELLFISIWWGRIAGSDLILDVATGEFIYKKMFYFNLSNSYDHDSKKNSENLDEQDQISLDDTYPELHFRLEHSQGAIPEIFQSFKVTSSVTAFDTIREISIVPQQPLISTLCFMEASHAELIQFEAFLQTLLAERSANAPPRPLDTVCRNCTIFQMSWTLDGEEGSLEFSEQRPYRYVVMDGLFDLVGEVLERLKAEGECDA